MRAGLDLANAEVAPALREFATGVIPPGASWAPAVTLDVPVGEPSEAVIEAARRHGAALVVMGTQGLGGVRKLLLGSTAERVLRQTQIPVLAVPPRARDGVVMDAAGPRLDVGRILVATDFSEPADAALRWAAGAARRMSLPLVLAHVVHETAVPSQWRAYAAESDEERVAAARAKLGRLAREVCAPVPCEIVVSIGRPADTLPSIAQAHGAGLIVAGLAREAGALAPRPGSIAYSVLCHARVPVLVVPASASAS